MKEHDQVNSALGIIRPAMQADGGNVELVDITDGVVSVRLCGTCVGCPSKSLTMKFGVEKTLREQLGWVREVVRVD